MIQIRSKVVPELEGCKSFGFKTKTRQTETSSLAHTSQTEHVAQIKMIAELKAVLDRLKVYPCEVEISIGSSSGESVTSGEIHAYDQSSTEGSEEVLSDADGICDEFSQIFSGSRFTVTFSQTVELTRVDH